MASASRLRREGGEVGQRRPRSARRPAARPGPRSACPSRRRSSCRPDRRRQAARRSRTGAGWQVAAERQHEQDGVGEGGEQRRDGEDAARVERSAMPPIEDTSAPSTKPACTPLDSSACRTGEIAASRAMSGNTAAEANHRLMPAISATTSSETDSSLDGLDPGMSVSPPWARHAVADAPAADLPAPAADYAEFGARVPCILVATALRLSHGGQRVRSCALPPWTIALASKLWSFRAHEFHPSRHPRPALHGHRHRLLCRQRHDDEARDRGPAALRGADAARRGGALWGFPLLLAARLRPPAAADVRAPRAAAQPARDGGDPVPTWWRSPTCRSPMPPRSGRSRRCWCCSAPRCCFGERIGGLRMALIGLGFVGALMVAQPTMQGISVYALLALGQRRVLRRARPRRAAGRRRCAGHDRRHLGRRRRAGRRRHRASAARGLGRAGGRATCCCSPAPASS